MLTSFNIKVWALVLSLLCIAAPSWRWATRQTTLILLSELAVYAYRDVWPLATYTKEPMDTADGRALWFKIGALFLTAVVVPVCIPSVYRPVDPKVYCPRLLEVECISLELIQHPAEQPNPEQTASVLSFNTYSYLSQTITRANKLDHLTPDDMPPIADYDRAENLTKASLYVRDIFCLGVYHSFEHPAGSRSS